MWLILLVIAFIIVLIYNIFWNRFTEKQGSNLLAVAVFLAFMGFLLEFLTLFLN